MEQKQTFLERSREFFLRQGFYLVLALCLLIIAAAIVLTVLPKETPVDPSLQATPDVVQSNQSGAETLRDKRTPLPTATPAPTAQVTPEPVVTPRPNKVARLAAAPIEGKIQWGFATDQLLYSKTLEQWTTHAGIDIAAELGSDVKAVLAGTVGKVYQDDALGQTVTVLHTNGRTSLYANLEEKVPVQEGQKVNAGDVLGKIGSTAVSECGEPAHLHFGFFVDEKAVNPLEHVLIPR